MSVHFVDIDGIDDHHCLNFLFIIIYSGPAKIPTSSGLSSGVQIGIIVISIVVVILIGYLVYKTVRVKMSMRDLDEEDNSATLYNLNNSTHSTHSHQNSYVPMPSQEQIEHLSRRELGK
jgi:hypothetical protein